MLGLTTNCSGTQWEFQENLGRSLRAAVTITSRNSAERSTTFLLYFLQCFPFWALKSFLEPRSEFPHLYMCPHSSHASSKSAAVTLFVLKIPQSRNLYTYCTIIRPAPERFVLGASDDEMPILHSKCLHASDVPRIPALPCSLYSFRGKHCKARLLHSACAMEPRSCPLILSSFAPHPFEDARLGGG